MRSPLKWTLNDDEYMMTYVKRHYLKYLNTFTFILKPLMQLRQLNTTKQDIPENIIYCMYHVDIRIPDILHTQKYIYIFFIYT